MSPLEVEILLHYYSRVDDHHACQNAAPIWRKTVENFVALGLMEEEPRAPDSRRAWRLTQKGNFYVNEGICKVPHPVTMLMIPWGNDDE